MLVVFSLLRICQGQILNKHTIIIDIFFSGLLITSYISGVEFNVILFWEIHSRKINYWQAGMKYFLRKTTVFFDFLTVRCLFVFFVVLIWQLYVLFMIYYSSDFFINHLMSKYIYWLCLEHQKPDVHLKIHEIIFFYWTYP
jgi:hypothetical protein